MSFDPDAYLATPAAPAAPEEPAFNPDQYLASEPAPQPAPPAAGFDPDAYLATPAPGANGGVVKQAAKLAARGALSEGIYAAIEGGARFLQGVAPEAAAIPFTKAAGLERDLNRQRSARNKLALQPTVDFTAYDQAEAQIKKTEQQLKTASTDAAGLKSYAEATASVRQSIRAALPVDQEFAQSKTGKISQGIGQAAGSLPLYVVPALGVAATVGQTYDEAYQDAKQSGASDATAHSAAMKYLPSAALDVLADKFVIGKILKPLKGKMTVGKLMVDILVTAAVEGAAEGAQQAYLNQIAAKLQGYDPERPFDQEVFDSILVGAVVGGVATGAGKAATAALQPNAQPGSANDQAIDPLAEVNAQINLLKQAETPAESSPVGAPAGNTLNPIEDDFSDLTPDGFTQGIDGSFELAQPAPAELAGAGPDVRPADSVPADSNTSLSDVAQAAPVTERSGAETLSKSPAKIKPAFRLGERPDGQPDLLDAIRELGGVRPPSAVAQAGGEYDGFKESFGRGGPRLLVKKKGQAVDQLIQELADTGYNFDSPDAFYAAVSKAAEQRVALVGQMRATQDQQKFEEAIFTNEGRRKSTAPAAPVNADQLNVGAKFKVHGEPFEVISISPDTGDVTVRDGPRFGTQVLPAGAPIYPDKKTMRQAKAAPAQENAPFARRKGEAPPDRNQADMFSGGETGGDTTFNLAGETAQDFTGIVEKQAELRAARKVSAAAQITLFARRSAEDIRADRAELEAARQVWRAEAERIAPGLMKRFGLEFGDPQQLVKKGKVRPSELTGWEQAFYDGHERLLYLFDQAVQTNSTEFTRLNLLHEMGHAHWDTLSTARLAELAGQWMNEMRDRTGPLFDGKKQLREGVAQGIETDIKEWYAERVAWTNHDWAKRRAAGQDVRINSPIDRAAQALRILLNKMQDWAGQLRGEKIDVNFRQFLDQGGRFESPAAASEFARRDDLNGLIPNSPKARSIAAERALKSAQTNLQEARRAGSPELIARSEESVRQAEEEAAYWRSRQLGQQALFARRAPGAAHQARTVAERMREAAENIGDWFRAELTSRGHLPEAVFAARVAKDGRVAAIQQRVQFGLRDLETAVRAVYGGWSAIPQSAQVQINDVLGGRAPLATLDPRLQRAVGTMRAQIDSLSRRLVREGVVSGDLAGAIAGNVGFYLNRSYRKFDDAKWAEKVDPAVVNRAATFIRAELQAQAPLLPVDEARVQGYLEYLLNKDLNGPEELFTRNSAGKDLSIFTKRKEIPAPLRELLGEYQDPRINYARSMAKMAQVLATHQFLTEARTAGMGKYFHAEPISTPEGSFTTKLAAEGSATLAPLNGLFTTPEIAAAFHRTFDESTPQNPAWRLFLALNGWTKTAKTVLHPVTQVRNLVANVGFLVANGHWHAADGGAAVLTALRADLTQGNQAGRDYLARLARHGIVGESTNAGEVREALRDAGVKMTGIEQWTDGLLARAAKLPLKAAERLYRLNDEIFKIYAFENEVQHWRAAMPGAPIEQVEQIAAERVRNTLPTYSLVPLAVQRIRRFALAGSFVSFPAEIVRTGYHTIRYAVTDLRSNNPVVRQMGARRLAGIAAAAAVIPAVAAASRWLNSIDDKDQEDLRRFLPEWNKNATLLYTAPKKAGRFSLVDLSYLDPWAYLRKPLLAAMRGEDWADKLGDAAAEVAAPFFGEGVLAKVLFDIARNRTEQGQPIYDMQAGPIDRQAQKLAHVWTALEPGFITQGKRITRAAKGEISASGRAYDLQQELTALLTGARSQSVDVGQVHSFKAGQFDGGLNQASMLYRRVRDRQGTVDPAEVKTARAKLEATREKLFDTIIQDTAAAGRLEVDQGLLLVNLLAAGLSKNEAAGVLGGVAMPYMETPLDKMEMIRREMAAQQAAR